MATKRTMVVAQFTDGQPAQKELLVDVSSLEVNDPDFKALVWNRLVMKDKSTGVKYWVYLDNGEFIKEPIV